MPNYYLKNLKDRLRSYCQQHPDCPFLLIKPKTNYYVNHDTHIISEVSSTLHQSDFPLIFHLSLRLGTHGPEAIIQFTQAQQDHFFKD